MTTSKPFATISYNSEDFLKIKLAEMIGNNMIDFYSYIKHIKEEDEAKDHIHLYIIPSCKCNTNFLLALLEEFEENNDKPLKCLPAVSSKFADWYMYAIHDKQYLLSKGQTRKHKYYRDNIISSSNEFLDDCIHRIDRSKWLGMEKIVSAVENGVTFNQLVRTGIVPVQLIHQYKFMYEVLSSSGCNRHGRNTHTPVLADPETGEIVTRHTDKNVLPFMDEPIFDYHQQGLLDD